MTDLFSNNHHGGRPGRTSKVAPAPAPIVQPEPQEPAPAFGSRGWTRCRCGRFASLHFPRAGGIRRCNDCAIAEGRWTPSDPIGSHAEIEKKDRAAR